MEKEERFQKLVKSYWTEHKYEDYNHCPHCNGVLWLKGLDTNKQTFKCKKCFNVFELNVITEEIKAVF